MYGLERVPAPPLTIDPSFNVIATLTPPEQYPKLKVPILPSASTYLLGSFNQYHTPVCLLQSLGILTIS